LAGLFFAADVGHHDVPVAAGELGLGGRFAPARVADSEFPSVLLAFCFGASFGDKAHGMFADFAQ
jgi:hypothetical protein